MVNIFTWIFSIYGINKYININIKMLPKNILYHKTFSEIISAWFQIKMSKLWGNEFIILENVKPGRTI